MSIFRSVLNWSYSYIFDFTLIILYNLFHQENIVYLKLSDTQHLSDVSINEQLVISGNAARCEPVRNLKPTNIEVVKTILYHSFVLFFS